MQRIYVCACDTYVHAMTTMDHVHVSRLHDAFMALSGGVQAR